jgi:hypothetical protein
MRKTTLIFCLTASGLLILDRFDAFEALLLFIVAGIIPGTEVSVPYYGMFILIALAILLFAWRLGRSKDFRKFLRKYSKVVKSPKKSLPKRRFSQI